MDVANSLTTMLGYTNESCGNWKWYRDEDSKKYREVIFKEGYTASPHFGSLPFQFEDFVSGINKLNSILDLVELMTVTRVIGLLKSHGINMNRLDYEAIIKSINGEWVSDGKSQFEKYAIEEKKKNNIVSNYDVISSYLTQKYMNGVFRPIDRER